MMFGHWNIDIAVCGQGILIDIPLLQRLAFGNFDWHEFSLIDMKELCLFAANRFNRLGHPAVVIAPPLLVAGIIKDLHLDGASLELALLERWLELGRHGDMGWMARHGRRRSRPAALVPGTVTVKGSHWSEKLAWGSSSQVKW